MTQATNGHIMKDTNPAYLFWFFFGIHYAYLGKWGWQMLYFLTLGGCGIWMLIDLFRIPKMVAKHNKKYVSRQ